MSYKWYAIDEFIEMLFERWKERDTTLLIMSTTIMNLDHIAANYVTIEEIFDEDELIFLKQVLDAYCEGDVSIGETDEYRADIIATYWEMFDSACFLIEQEGYVPDGHTSMYAIYAVRQFLDDPSSVIANDSTRSYFYQFLRVMMELVREERKALKEL